jgi:hypothetical protein
VACGYEGGWQQEDEEASLGDTGGVHKATSWHGTTVRPKRKRRHSGSIEIKYEMIKLVKQFD